MRIRIIYILLQRKRLLDGATEKAPNPIITRKAKIRLYSLENDSKQEKKNSTKICDEFSQKSCHQSEWRHLSAWFSFLISSE